MKKEYDYCIVGSGIGGGTLVSKLVNSGASVLLIEAGNKSHKSSQYLTKGRPFGLRSTTSIQLGGTSNLWHGVLSFLDDIDTTAKKIGSVNTVKISDGKLIGYNTDYLGFRESIISWLPNTNISALVLGSGGSSKAIKYVLDDLRISYKVISRDSSDMKISYKELKNLSMVSASKLIINTTPLGMSPNVDSFPDIDYNLINNKHFVFDLVYNPNKTKFLSLCEERGANIKNGYEMLVGQAEEAWKIWNK